jgi:hypothetical protein
MSVDLRTPTATNYHTFDGGDSLFKSTNLVAATLECASLIIKSIREYNLDNILEYPAASLSYDDNERTASLAINAPYQKVANVKIARNYLDPYAGWVTPTTGELVGKATLLDAWIYFVDSMVYGNEKLQESAAIKDVKGLFIFTDDNNENQYTTSATVPYSAITDTATGIVQNVAQDYLVLLDMQEGFPI